MGSGIWALLPISWLPNTCVFLAAFPRFQGANNPKGLELEVQELRLPEHSSHDVGTEAFPRPGEPLEVWPGGGSLFSKGWNPGSPALEWFKWNSWSELQKSGASLGVLTVERIKALRGLGAPMFPWILGILPCICSQFRT